MKSRIIIVFVFLSSIWISLLVRGFVLQMIPSEKLTQLKQRQFHTTLTLNSKRGAIVDRHGRDLALSETAYSLFGNPEAVVGRKSLSRRLAKELSMPFDAIDSKLSQEDKKFVWIARMLPKSKMEKIKKLKIKSLGFVEEPKRVYPNDQLLAQVLGFVGRDGNGLEGLEKYYDETLTKNKKKVAMPRDAKNRPLFENGFYFLESPEGFEMKLTVDSDIQHRLEAELSQVFKDTQSEQVQGVILDARTSAVVAMASYPYFNPNSISESDAYQRKNRVVTDVFEPGSTLKTFALASALREGLITPNKKYNTENGSLKIGDRVIREAELDHKWKELSVGEILAFSSNIGTTKIAFELGGEKLRQGLLDFGFGSKAGIDLPGEAKGAVQPLPWMPHLLSNISFGQGISVTALQMANAYAAIANGGILRKPYLVHSLRDPDSGVEKIQAPQEIRRVLSEKESADMRLMLMGVTAPGGTGVNAKVDGFLVAGKTGTAQKPNPKGRGYLPHAYISSFAGFIPANDPKYVIFVMVDYPKNKSYYGSVLAAPLFSKLAYFVARKSGLPPVLLSERNLLPRELKDLNQRQFLTSSKNQKKESIGSVSKMAKGAPAAAKYQTSEMNLEVLSSAKASTTSPGVPLAPLIPTTSDLAPPLVKLTLREVTEKSQAEKIQLKVHGSGVVTKQIPEPGYLLEKNRQVEVFLE